jgi:hypothetical protein
MGGYDTKGCLHHYDFTENCTALFEAWVMYLSFIFKDIQSSSEQQSWIPGG